MLIGSGGVIACGGCAKADLSAQDRERIAKIAVERPSVDLEIAFNSGSAELTPAAISQLADLGKALIEMPSDGVFLIAGHTDASGSEVYNFDLSQRRADAIRHYLIDYFAVPAGRLVTVGFGKTRLKNKAQPYAEENRRVQVQNLTGEPLETAQWGMRSSAAAAVQQMAARFASGRGPLADLVREHQDIAGLWRDANARLIDMLRLPDARRDPSHHRRAAQPDERSRHTPRRS
jgi:hypothetical protein